MLRISGSSISSRRTPQTVPVILPTFGLSPGACWKNVSRSFSRSSCSFNVCGVYPVSQQMTSSTSFFVRPFLSTFCTYRGYTLEKDIPKIGCFVIGTFFMGAFFMGAFFIGAFFVGAFFIGCFFMLPRFTRRLAPQELAGLQVRNRTPDLLLRVHDERTISDDRLVQRLTGEEQRARVLLDIDPDGVAPLV